MTILRELEARASFHGWGFFHAALLPAEELIDRTRIQEQIAARDFDLVVVGSVCHDILVRAPPPLPTDLAV